MFSSTILNFVTPVNPTSTYHAGAVPEPSVNTYESPSLNDCIDARLPDTYEPPVKLTLLAVYVVVSGVEP